MTHDAEHQMDLDIAAYVNGQLDGERRFAVAAYLADHPGRAAEVMNDLRLTEGLRLAMGTVQTSPSAALDLAAAKVARGLEARDRMRRWMPFAAAVAMFACGWFAQSLVARLPTGVQTVQVASLVEAAVDAHDAVNIRLSLTGELGPLPRNADEISDRLSIVLPDLPKGWSVRGAQVIATPERPGLALVIDTPDLGEVMLFSVKRTVDGPDNPVVTSHRDGIALASFEMGQTGYVLIDNSGSVSALRRGAENLRHRLN